MTIYDYTCDKDDDNYDDECNNNTLLIMMLMVVMVVMMMIMMMMMIIPHGRKGELSKVPSGFLPGSSSLEGSRSLAWGSAGDLGV